jgi:hypothetical protein
MFTDELQRKKIDSAKAFLKVLEAQPHIDFHDVIIGDENWIFLNTYSSSIWIGAEEMVPTRSKMIAFTEKAMLTVFWGIKAVILIN